MFGCVYCAAEFLPKIHVARHASHVAISKINFKIFAKRHPSQRNQLRHYAALQTENLAQTLKIYPQLHNSKGPLVITLLSSLPNALPCCQPAFTGRTRGHCLSTFRAINFLIPPPTLIISAFPFTAQPLPDFYICHLVLKRLWNLQKIMSL